MDLESMTREELLQHIKELNQYMENVVVFWGGKQEFKETFRQVAQNSDGEYTDEEAQNAAVLLEAEGAFDNFIEVLRDSFDRGGINYLLSEKISALMDEVASRYRKN
jgi:hypothetical protein